MQSGKDVSGGGGGSSERGPLFRPALLQRNVKAAVRQSHKNVSGRHCPQLKFYYDKHPI
jgi:hypothetical protein